MILAPTLSLFSPGGRFLDSDARAFAAASGATDVAALSAFAKGIKALGLWNSMVCWPMRSTQNAGTGTTVFSFGGLSGGNATLVNGPTWGANGIASIVASTHSITVAAWPISQANTFAIGYVANTSAYNGNADSMGGDGGVYNILGWGIGTQMLIIQNDGDTTGPATGETLNAWQSIFGSRERNATGGRRAYRNGSLNASLNANNNSLTPPGNFWISKKRTETRAFAFVLNTNLTDSLATEFNTIYKSTLGAGLGLP